MTHVINSNLSDQLSYNDPDYERGCELFLKSCNDTHYIVAIRRILGNELQKAQYNLLKNYMDANGGANEKQLFHGTDAGTVNKIIANGFNRSFSKTSAFGKGVYFAATARYSANPKYASPNPSNESIQSMFIARVLVGNYTRGQANMRTPPALNGSNKVYDSLVDNPYNPQIFVSCHNDNQAYPELLLEFLPFEKNNVFHNNPYSNHRNPFSQRVNGLSPPNIFTRNLPTNPFSQRVNGLFSNTSFQNTIPQPIQGMITPGGFQIF